MASQIELEEIEMDSVAQNIDEGPVSATNFESIRGDLVKKLNLDNGVEDLLNVLDPRMDCNEMADFDFEKKTKGGNTLLHCVTKATIYKPEGMESYMQLVDRIAEKCVIWWCRKKGVTEAILGEHKHDAMKYLLTEPLDRKKRSVWKIAFEKVSVAMIEKLMYLEGVTYCKESGVIRFDVSNFTKYLNFSLYNLFESAVLLYYKNHVVEPGLEELLERAKLENKVAEVLSIEPIRKIADMYSSFTAKLSAFIVLLHILYMSLFSYVGCDLMDSTKPIHSKSSKIVIYTFGLIEPIILSSYLFNEVFKCIGVMYCFDDKVKGKKIRIRYMKKFSFRFFIVLVYTVLLCLVIASVDQTITTRERYILSICLLLGWLFTLFIADGIQTLHFFFKLVVTVMVTDVVKILLVYIIFLIGFSLAIHAQFLSSSNITSTYKTPIHTMYLMFNVMMGMEEAVNNSTEVYLEEANSSPMFSKILYILYVLCSSIILLNLLIAMVNTSYSKIRDKHSYEWVCETARFGIKAAEYFPVLARWLGVKYVKKGRMFKNPEIEDVWYIELPDLQRNEEEDDIDGPTNTDMHQVDSNAIFSENDLKSQITKLISTQQDMMSGIQRLEIQLSTLTGTGTQDRHMTVNEAGQA